ncbi:hypothetical protein L227DRAFT_426163 [Lentinus tigrinus ALCF2SS1-6]|uniref:Uncharacterized protein n=1 Tax=Lentinus tigrinus ALCF2SS1-6 TaxID=1328759 RepID=A0A5C2RMV1_9APHY|nr:hypothetical protein L227DRAFT_426163 [Lentinus tigrinus ALCF2SS1-6]
MSLGRMRTRFKHKESSCSVLRERRSVSHRARKGDGPRKRVVARMLSAGDAKPIGGLQAWLPEYVKPQEKRISSRASDFLYRGMRRLPAAWVSIILPSRFDVGETEPRPDDLPQSLVPVHSQSVSA